MKKYLLAIAVASGALVALSAQAAPVTSTSGVQNQVTGSVEQVRHCRYWSGGWGCGWGGHSRYWSHRRHGSRGYWR
jgi:hypothetical protein